MVIGKLYMTPSPVTTRSQAKAIITEKMNTSQGSENKTEEKMKLNIPAFKGKGSIKIENWVKLFEKLTEDKQAERKQLVLNFLEEDALDFFIERELYSEEWESMKIQLQNYFSTTKAFNMEEFLNVTLQQCESIEEYYKKKTDAAAKLKIEEDFLIQILINGLPYYLKTLNLTKSFSTTHEWLEFNKPLFYHMKKPEQSSSTKNESRATNAMKSENVPHHNSQRIQQGNEDRNTFVPRRQQQPRYDNYFPEMPRMRPSWRDFPPPPRYTPSWRDFPPPPPPRYTPSWRDFPPPPRYTPSWRDFPPPPRYAPPWRRPEPHNFNGGVIRSTVPQQRQWNPQPPMNLPQRQSGYDDTNPRRNNLQQ